MSAPTLDVARFAKVRALHDSTTQPGERAAAADRMAALAQAAGMTVEAAMAAADGNADPWAAFVADRAREQAARAAAVLAQYPSKAALFADTPIEAALRAACAPLLGAGQTWRDIYTLDGWDGWGSVEKMPPRVRAAVSRAWAMPATVQAAWGEYAATEKLDKDRAAVDPGYLPERFAAARQLLVEEMLNTTPARSLNDIRARLDWLDFWAHHETDQEVEDHRTTLATLRADVERMAARIPRRAA